MINLMQFVFNGFLIIYLMNLIFLSLKSKNAIIYDVKNFLKSDIVDGHL